MKTLKEMGIRRAPWHVGELRDVETENNSIVAGAKMACAKAGVCVSREREMRKLKRRLWNCERVLRGWEWERLKLEWERRIGKGTKR